MTTVDLPEVQALPFPALRVDPPWTQATPDGAVSEQYLADACADLERARLEYRLGHFREAATGAQDLLLRVTHRLDLVDASRPGVEAATRVAASAATLVGRTRRILADTERAPEAFKQAVLLFETVDGDGLSDTELTDYGISLEATDERERAIATLRAAMAAGEETSEALRHLGDMLHEVGQLEEAEAVLRRAVECDSQDPVARRRLGEVLESTGRSAEAAAEYERAGFDYGRGNRLTDAEWAFEAALRLGRETALLQAARGEVLRRRGRATDALEALERALALDAEVAWAWASKAAVLLERRRRDEALAAIKTALEREPEYAVAHELHGRLLRLAGDHAGAIAALSEARRLEPTLLGAYVELGAALFDADRPDEAVAVLRDGLARAPDVPWFRAAVGEAFRAGGRRDEAIGLLRGAVERDPSLVRAEVGLADALADAGETSQALAAADGAFAQGVTSAPAARRMARLLRDLGRLPEAEAMARRAIDYDRSSASAYVELATVLERSGRSDDALTALDELLAIHPDNPKGLARKGRILRAQGALSAAEAVLQSARDADPGSARVAFDLALTLWRLGEDDDAVAALEGPLKDRRYGGAALVLRAAVRVTNEDPDGALADLEAAEDYGPLDGFGLAIRARALHEVEGFDEGRANLDRALALDSDDVEVIGEIGDVLRRYGDHDTALAQLDRALKLAPGSPWVLATKGQVIASMDDFGGALELLERAVAIEPRLAWAQAALGETLRMLGRGEEAVHALDAALRRRPAYEWALASRGAALRDLKRQSEALVTLERALALDAEDWFARATIACVLAEGAQYEAALEHVGIALEARVHHWPLGLKGWALEQLGPRHAADALAAYRAAFSESGDAIAYGRGIGESLMMLGRREEAVQEYWRAIEAASQSDDVDAFTLAVVGWCYYAVDRPEQAVRAYSEALYRDPSMVDTELDLALAQLASGRATHGERLFDRAIAHLDLLDPLRLRGIITVALGDLKEALDRGRIPADCLDVARNARKRLRAALKRADQEAAERLERLRTGGAPVQAS